MQLLRRPISASDRIPDRFYVISIEFLSQTFLLAKRPWRRRARRNGCFRRLGTREISQYINHMQERNDYDYIVIHSGTNDVGKLTANEIRTNMENWLVNLKHKWLNSTI